MAKRISVVLAQGQSHNPQKRQLEESLVAALMMTPNIDLVIIPHLYDLTPDGTGVLALQGITGDLIVLSWLYQRAARWTLARYEILGQHGACLINSQPDADDEEEASHDGTEADATEDPSLRVLNPEDLPSRKIYCLELRTQQDAAAYVEEVQRITREATTDVVATVGLGDWIQGDTSVRGMDRYRSPTNDTAMGLPENGPSNGNRHASNENKQGRSNGAIPPGNGQITGTDHDADHSKKADTIPEIIEPFQIDEQTSRRWYPVIDFSRCTNCMECIDFCLFGVYGVDGAETILVEQPDNCRKGCPACSRVCPENAIMFPQHKTPGIAGAPGAVAGMKVDLSRLFGAPDAATMAARERDEQLLLAGREIVGTQTADAIPPTSPGDTHEDAGDSGNAASMKTESPTEDSGDSASANQSRDALDDLIDGLDELDL